MLKNFSPSTASYEETFKTAYSHGLEEIYSLENVDISSIKPISIEPKKEQKAKPKRAKPPHSSDLLLDLGGEFRKTLPPFYLDEPIQLLALSKPVERTLLDQGKLTLGDLKEYQAGQGLKEEIERRLESYLKDQEPGFVDFFSFIRCLTGTQDRRRVKVALEPYQLEEVVSLSPLENMEIKRLSEERKRDWMGEFYGKLEEKVPYARSKMSDVFDVFIRPWMRNRFGLATRLELMERLQRISENPEAADGILKFISAIAFNGSAFDALLLKVDEDLYCVDQPTRERFSQIVAKASTYFYKPHIRYPLPELTLLLKQEFAVQWQGYEGPFIEKSLRLSSQFRVRKGAEGVLSVRLS